MTPLDQLERESRLLHILDAGTRLISISHDRTISGDLRHLVTEDLPRLLAEVRALLPPA